MSQDSENIVMAIENLQIATEENGNKLDEIIRLLEDIKRNQ